MATTPPRNRKVTVVNSWLIHRLYNHGFEDLDWGPPREQIALGLMLHARAAKIGDRVLQAQVQTAAEKIVAANAGHMRK